jgi:hypothetical protein
MCFSASASFAASGALAASSYAISRIPKRKSEIPVTLIPAIFAAHQFIEGILWLNHLGLCPELYKSGGIYAYSLIAYTLWPIYIPFAVYKLETDKLRRAVILLCQAMGVYVSITSLISIFGNPVDVTILGQSLSYSIRTPEFIMAPYFISVSLPFLISNEKKLVLFGGGLTLSCILAAVMASSSTFPSVWCFYAAVLSAGLYLYFKTAEKSEQPVIHEVSYGSR